VGPFSACELNGGMFGPKQMPPFGSGVVENSCVVMLRQSTKVPQQVLDPTIEKEDKGLLLATGCGDDSDFVEASYESGYKPVR
jgi:hypothetical protein